MDYDFPEGAKARIFRALPERLNTHGAIIAISTARDEPTLEPSRRQFIVKFIGLTPSAGLAAVRDGARAMGKGGGSLWLIFQCAADAHTFARASLRYAGLTFLEPTTGA